MSFRSDEKQAEKLAHDEEKKETAHQKQVEHDDAERAKKPTSIIHRYAADLLEQESKRPRDIIENEVAMAVTNEAQRALIRAIIAQIDGSVPEIVIPKERVYSESYKKNAKEKEDALELEKNNEKSGKSK